MMPLLIIITGLIMALVGSLMLLRFMSSFSDLVARFNSIYQGEVHSLNEELKEELDELNYSYYDILDKQDERISKLEKLTDRMVSGEAPPFCVVDDAGSGDNSEAARYIDGTLGVLSKQVGSSAEMALDEGNSSVDQIKRLYHEGKTTEEIAGELGLGSGYVDLILSLYVNKREE